MVAFDVGQTFMSGTVPTEVGRLSNLLELDLSPGDFWGEIPKALIGCTSLTNLGLASTRINGSFPGLVSLLSPPLPWLFVQNSRFTGKVQLLECVGLVITVHWEPTMFSWIDLLMGRPRSAR